MMKKLLAVLLCAAPLAGCGFTPLYGENSLAAAPDEIATRWAAAIDVLEQAEAAHRAIADALTQAETRALHRDPQCAGSRGPAVAGRGPTVVDRVANSRVCGGGQQERRDAAQDDGPKEGWHLH